jgi:hypothetical protein
VITNPPAEEPWARLLHVNERVDPGAYPRNPSGEDRQTVIASGTDAPGELCSEREVADLVEGFYGRVRGDRILGPIFARHVADWDLHMPKMIDFGSSALRKTARNRGTPMPAHVELLDEAAGDTD